MIKILENMPGECNFDHTRANIEAAIEARSNEITHTLANLKGIFETQLN